MERNPATRRRSRKFLGFGKATFAEAAKGSVVQRVTGWLESFSMRSAQWVGGVGAARAAGTSRRIAEPARFRQTRFRRNRRNRQSRRSRAFDERLRKDRGCPISSIASRRRFRRWAAAAGGTPPDRGPRRSRRGGLPVLQGEGGPAGVAAARSAAGQRPPGRAAHAPRRPGGLAS